MKEYLSSMSKTMSLILNNKTTSEEVDRFAKSDSRWAENKAKNYQTRSVKKGEIYQFEFGKNYSPEMSYEHRGLVIGVNKKLLYVLPIFSYDEKKHKEVYHPVDNRTSKSDLYLLKKDDYAFIQHDSVMKLNDIRTVSVNRILYRQQDGRIDINSLEYKNIEKLVMMKCFPSIFHEYSLLEKANGELEKEIADIKQKLNDLKSQTDQSGDLCKGE